MVSSVRRRAAAYSHELAFVIAPLAVCRYIGAYTLFGTHEIAVMSGLAVAERLGAPYPFAHDPLAAQQFDTYLSIAHGTRRKRSNDQGSKKEA